MDEQEAETPPTALFVYRRHRELERTLACLRESGARRLYVFSDGPADDAATHDVERVRARLAAIDWTEPVIVEQRANLGLSASIRAGLDRVFAEHASAVVVEDDVCVAPGFHHYAALALDHYAAEKRVAGVTGLRYPFDLVPLAGYPYDVFHSPRFSSWAWATWRDRWQRFEFNLPALRRRISAARAFRPSLAGADMPGMIEAAIVRETLGGSWDVACAANMLLDGSTFVTPVWNMVENSGLADGTHADGAPPWQLTWEPERAPAGEPRFAPVGVEDEQLLTAYRRFFAVPGRRARVAAALAGLRPARRGR